jgi:hypothetical protein
MSLPIETVTPDKSKDIRAEIQSAIESHDLRQMDALKGNRFYYPTIINDDLDEATISLREALISSNGSDAGDKLSGYAVLFAIKAYDRLILTADLKSNETADIRHTDWSIKKQDWFTIYSNAYLATDSLMKLLSCVLLSTNSR